MPRGLLFVIQYLIVCIPVELFLIKFACVQQNWKQTGLATNKESENIHEI